MSRRSNPNADRPLRKTQGRPREHRVVYVAVEGETTEVHYFDYVAELIADEQIALHVLYEKNGLKPQDTVDKILGNADGNAERWVMFDRDEHHEIPEAIARAKRMDRMTRASRALVLKLSAARNSPLPGTRGN